MASSSPPRELRPAPMDPLTPAPKHSSTCSPPPTPPPAYFPRHFPPGTTTHVAASSVHNGQAHFITPYQPAMDAVEAGLAAAWNNDGDYSDDDNWHSPLVLDISTAVKVSGDGNILCMSARPANTAQLIAEAVTQAIRQSSSEEHGGFPMIDEQGRPRPVKINIDASLAVNGKGNVVAGEAGVVERLFKKQHGSAVTKMRSNHKRVRSASV
ncbi:hypothetical protein BD289DRAFT_442394 [Coniella lustricola]|uniref:Uncharacterized protein n=1 Tax=Coniella lustricola TaxID=2025994 RepID=A0A2T2ZY78_9PEZI|nr:hypothetical protein BD289DRAFT_442394 [Coniella lustricola]